MKRDAIIQVGRSVLNAIAGVAVLVFLLLPLRSLVFMIASLVLAVICFGAAELLGLAEIPNPPPGSKHDPSRPLGL